MRMLARLAIIIGITVAAGLVAEAGVITSLKSTGIDAAGQVMSSGTDPHYSLLRIDYVGPWGSATYDPLNPPPPRPAPPVGPAVFDPPLAGRVVPSPHPAWVANSATSRWISQVADASSSAYGGFGRYVYRTTFDLAGEDPRSVRIEGAWGADDFGWMYLNLADPTVPQRARLVASSTSFGILQPFSIDGSSGLFRTGLNTLTFFTWDSGAGITGLRVDITSVQSDVPEFSPTGIPGALALGAASLALLDRRRREGYRASAGRRPGDPRPQRTIGCSPRRHVVGTKWGISSGSIIGWPSTQKLENGRRSPVV